MTSMIQEATERRLSKRVLKGKFEEQLQMCGPVLQAIEACKVDIEATYLGGDHYAQKNERLSKWNINQMEKIVVHIMYVVSGCEFMSLSNLMGQCAGVVPHDYEYYRLQTIGELSAYMAKHGLIGMQAPQHSESGMLTVYPTFHPDERFKQRVREAQYLPPMVAKPNIIKHNRGSGWLVTDFGSLITKKGNHHDKDINLDALNKRNQIAFKLDFDYLCTVDEQIPEDVLNGTPDDDGKVTSLEQYQRYMAETHEMTKYLKDTGNKFYFLHKRDKRKRLYSQGYHVGYQQNSYRKGMIELADEEIVEM